MPEHTVTCGGRLLALALGEQIVSRFSESRATLPLYASDCQKMSQGCGMLATSSVTWSVRHAMPVA